jgi:hypothetical protein
MRGILAVAFMALSVPALAQWPDPAYHMPTTIRLVQPTRIIDTRIPGPALGEYPKTGEPYALGGPLLSGEIRQYMVQADLVPVGAQGVVVTVTVVAPTGSGHLLAFDPTIALYEPFPSLPPLASTLNFTAGQTVATTTFVALGQLVGASPGDPFWPDFALFVHVSDGGRVHVVVDVLGYLLPQEG